MIARYVHILLIFVAVALAACGDSALRQRLDRAAALVESDPAAALAICDSIADPESLPDADRALFGYVDGLAAAITGDSVRSEKLLDYAIDYYSTFGHRERRLAMSSIFAKAEILTRQRDFADAVVWSAEGLLLANALHDHLWRGRIYRQMAEISVEYLNYPQAIQFSDSAIAAFEQANYPVQAQYQVITTAGYLSASGRPVEAIYYLDSIFTSDTEFFGNNREAYYVEMSEACSRAQRIDSAMFYLEKLDSATFVQPPYDLLQTLTVTLAASGRFEECDSVMRLYLRLSGIAEARDQDLNYQSTAYAVNKYKGNETAALWHLENCVSITEAMQNMTSSATVMNYHGLVEREEAKIREGRARSVLALTICCAVIFIILMLAGIAQLKARHALKNKEDDNTISKQEATILSLQNKLDNLDIALNESAGAVLNSLIKEFGNGGSRKSEAEMARFDAAVRNAFAGTVYGDVEKAVDRRRERVVKNLEDIGLNKLDIKILVLSKWGLNLSAIATIVELNQHTVTVRRSRAKDRISKSSSEQKQEILDFFWG